MSLIAPTGPGPKASARGFLLFAVFLFVVLSALFYESFKPGKVVFNNDGPYGAIKSQAAEMPQGFFGLWQDLNWFGAESVSASPSISAAFSWALGPLGFAKFYAPLSFFIVGLCAALFFRQLGFAAVAWVTAGLAAALNSDFFSTGCWGVAAQPICVGANYAALALISTNPSTRHPWLRTILAGFCVGLGVVEAFDIGAIFSIFTAAYVLYQSWNNENAESVGKKLGTGVFRVGVVAIFAGWIAAQTVSVLIGTQVKGIVGTDQDQQTKQQQWNFATQWSVPKIETFQIIFPGVFGYRMDTPDGANYWGSIGEYPEITRLIEARDAGNEEAKRILDTNGSLWRFTGSGIYAGVPVVVIALWAAFQSFRKKGSPFSLVQCRSIWFWIGVAVVGLLLGYGKYAPFYQFFFALPYASTIRNPFKFMHVFNWALIVLFAYGLQGIYRSYMQNTPIRTSGKLMDWSRFSAFDRKWFIGMLAALVLGILGWAVYSSSRPALEAHLQKVGFDAAMAHPTAGVSIASIGWFVLFLALTMGLLVLIFSGKFAGARASTGTILFAGLVFLDLGRANLPWRVFWDTTYKYASNPILDILRKEGYTHRVTMLPYGGGQQLGAFQQVYAIEWVQQLFEYYNIQALDVIQEPRVGSDKKKFVDILPYNPNQPFNLLRTWELGNVQYLLGPGGTFVDALNQQFDPQARRFRMVQPFNVARKTRATGYSPVDYTVEPNPNGEVALIEFTGALPRASLFSNWEVSTNDDASMKTLASPAFDPHKTVLVAESIPLPPASNTNQSAGTVKIKPNYEPKRIEMEADVKTPSVLLLTDRYNPKWQVTVDGKPAPLLRANYIFRGLYLEPGHHDILFRFVIPLTNLYVSVAAIVFALGLCGWLAVDRARPAEVVPTEAPADSTKSKPAKP